MAPTVNRAQARFLKRLAANEKGQDKALPDSLEESRAIKAGLAEIQLYLSPIAAFSYNPPKNTTTTHTTPLALRRLCLLNRLE